MWTFHPSARGNEPFWLTQKTEDRTWIEVPLQPLHFSFYHSTSYLRSDKRTYFIAKKMLSCLLVPILVGFGVIEFLNYEPYARVAHSSNADLLRPTRSEMEHACWSVESTERIGGCAARTCRISRHVRGTVDARLPRLSKWMEEWQNLLRATDETSSQSAARFVYGVRRSLELRRTMVRKKCEGKWRPGFADFHTLISFLLTFYSLRINPWSVLVPWCEQSSSHTRAQHWVHR